MDSNLIPRVFATGIDVIRQIQDTQSGQIDQVARAVADCFLTGHSFYVSGSGHSHTLAEEFYARAGGLAFVIPILTTELTMTEHPTKSSLIERLDGYADILAELYHIGEGDVVLIASNSGRNSYPVDLATAAKQRGATVCAITSFRHSAATSPRNRENKHLIDVADISIDNCGVPGDCALAVDGIPTALCPTSSMANTFIAQGITVQAAQYISEAGKEPPVFVSLNSEGTEHVNDDLFATYTRMY